MRRFQPLNDQGVSEDGLNPITLIQQEALELSGLTPERAYAFEDYCLGKVYEETTFMHLADVFYAKVYETKDEAFRKLFSDDKEQNIQNLSDYLVQRSGGQSFYSNRNGIPMLAAKHARFNITQQQAELWLEYMEEALEDVRRQISEPHRIALLDFMRLTAYTFVVYGKYNKDFIKRTSLF